MRSTKLSSAHIRYVYGVAFFTEFFREAILLKNKEGESTIDKTVLKNDWFSIAIGWVFGSQNPDGIYVAIFRDDCSFFEI